MTAEDGEDPFNEVVRLSEECIDGAVRIWLVVMLVTVRVSSVGALLVAEADIKLGRRGWIMW